MIDITPFIISVKLASITTILLFMFCLPIAWFLSQNNFKLKPLIETIAALPLVLPPSVIGFYILFALSKNSIIGSFFKDNFDIELVFNFTGLVIASCIYSLPFMLQPLQNGFESLNKNMLEASYIGGKSKLVTLFKVAIPNIKSSLLVAFIITFAHTIGEFGVVLMIGGSIQNETKVASVAIYEFVELLDYKMAHIYSFLMLFMSFCVLFLVYFLKTKNKLLS